jgi:hypothetical protein
LFDLLAQNRPRVLSEVAGDIRFEHGSAEGFGSPERAALLVQWSQHAGLNRSFTTLANECASAGYQVVVVSACEDPAPLDWRGKRPGNVVVIRKPNIGYDFGSVAVGLHLLPSIATARHVIVANDSMIGPFATMRPIIERLESNPVDVQGLTDTRQYFHHLQSYFLFFNDGVLADRPLARFFADVRVEPSKWEIIRRYELGLSVLLRREGYAITSAFRADDVVSGGDNPVIAGWWRLLEQGYPFVKREIVRNPQVAPRAEWVAREVAAVFGERLEEWI